MNGASKRTLAVVLSLTATLAVIAAIAFLSPGHVRAGAAMTAFASDKDLSVFLARQKRAEADVFGGTMATTTSGAAGIVADSAAAPAADAAAAPALEAPPAPATLSASGAASDKITNTQEAEVDEGGIVKAKGDLLVILRRGRLFTVSTAGGGLRPVDRIDAFPPGANPDAWYDEMLIAGDRVAVVGYSYERGGAEINRFRLSPDGRLSFIDSHALRSADYYSSRNYASRLIGNRMIFYTELPAVRGEDDPMAVLPALRRWTPDQPDAAFRPIVSSRRVYAPPQVMETDGAAGSLHTVTTCDLAAEVFDCDATVVIGPSQRSFYVSKNAVYLWVHDEAWDRRKTAPDMLYRMPLDGGAPSAIEVNGVPIDQFSFRETADGERLQVLVARDGGGDGMWNAELASKPRKLALLSLPLNRLNDGRAVAGPELYRKLPSAAPGWNLHNRFVGDHLLYGTGAGWEERSGRKGLLLAAPLDGGPVASIDLPHTVDRIEVMGPDAVVVGSDDQAVWFSTIKLGAAVAPGDRYRLGGASEAESRSHGFFYRADSPDGLEGVLGLPISRAARPAFHQLFENSAALLFLRRADDRFQPLGQLAAADTGIVDDGCLASCVDWYGNARPVFLRGRVYALLGYELVEGRVDPDRIVEVGRVSFAPPGARPAGR